jgi:isocitrate dehydrogenase
MYKKESNKILLPWYQTAVMQVVHSNYWFCKTRRFDPNNGSVPNVGLMAQKRENTDLTTRLSKCNGWCSSVVDTNGTVLMEQTVQANDILECVKPKTCSYSRLGKTSCKQSSFVPNTQRFSGWAFRAHDRELIVK